ncbi:hypothetical protein FG386_003574 [Cryptosporidium ryanae]|uniref:uncharacterized protein n=1 Tax=Cryptosporidium ryanae TaxID=515981 RepID=UPI00351A399C|nr:hypothetical protein FG386_003574 [Cryptosporidium ryanae]
MGFEIILAKCINSEELNKEDIKAICDLLNDKTININEVIFSLESELVSPIVNQKKRGIEIISELLWNYLPNENFTNTHIKLISCFVLNYIYDWACIDAVISILRCIFETQNSDMLKSIKIDIRDDDNVFEEYSFNPIMQIKDGSNSNINTNFGKIKIFDTSDSHRSRKYLKSYFEICSYHKFNNIFGVEDAKDDDDLYKMSLPFYLITQILYKVTTRQLVYSSRIIIVDFILFVFKNSNYDDELSRLGPGIVPILIQHIENEKDPRVLIKAFPLMEVMIKKFYGMITLYDKGNAVALNSNLDIEYGHYQIYHGRIPKLSKKEESRLVDKYKYLFENNKNFKNGLNDPFENFDLDQPLSSNGEILSSLISETLFAYFPLQFNSPNVNNKNQKGRIPKKDLKNVYFSAITCSDIIQDFLIQSIFEYVDTQGLLENIEFGDESNSLINEYGQIDEDTLNKNYVDKQSDNKPINMNKLDEEIFEDIICIFGMIKYEIDPCIINKYIPGVFLLLNELLKNTLISTDKVHKLLLIVFSIFVNLELKYKYGQNVVISSINKFVIPNIFNKINSNSHLDKFSFNILQIFVLTGNEAIIDNIKDKFLLKGISDGGNTEKINLNLKLLITIYLIKWNYDLSFPPGSIYITEGQIKVPTKSEDNIDSHALTSLEEYDDRVKCFLELTRSSINKYIDVCKTKTKSNTCEYHFSLAEICIYTIYNFELGFINDVSMLIFDLLKHFWKDYCSLSENDKNYLIGLVSFCLVFRNNEAKNYWLSYYNNEDISNYNNIYALEYVIYTVMLEDYVAEDLISSFVGNIKSNIIEIIKRDDFSINFCYLEKKLVNTVDILNSSKWKFADLKKHLTFEIEEWINTIIHLVDLSFGSEDFIKMFFENKNTYYKIFKNLAIITIKLFNIHSSEYKVELTITQIFEIISDKILKIENKMFILLYINELTSKLLTYDVKFNINSINTILDTCIEWVNKNNSEYNDDISNKLINDEIEKFIINSLLLEKDKFNIKKSILSKLDQKNNVIIGKISRYYLFSQTSNFEVIYQEIKDSLNKLQTGKCTNDSQESDDQSNLQGQTDDNLNLELFDSIKLLYIIGSDLNLMKNQNYDNISLLLGKTKYILESNDTEDCALFNSIDNSIFSGDLYLVPLMSVSNPSTFTINILSVYNNHNNGKFLYQILDYYVNSHRTNEKTNITFYRSIGSTENDEIENSQVESLCDIWPTVIPITNNSYPVINLNDKLIQERIIYINKIIVDHYKHIFTDNLINYRNSTLLLIPLVSNMNNLNISIILNNYSSSMLNSILFLSLLECTNYLSYKSTRCVNTNLFNYIVDLAEIQNTKNKDDKNTDSTLDPNFEITKLLRMKETPKNNSTRSNKELFIFNMQSLSVLMRIIHYSRENKLTIYENKSNGKHKLDFIFENLRVYSVLVLNIIENHPNSLVRFISLLIISQIFKFPSVFRTNTKNSVMKTLTIASNNDPNKKLRELSSILKLKIVTMNDHIYI